MLVINEERKKYRQITKEYEFRNVIILENIIKDNIKITLFRQLTLVKVKNFRLRNYDEIKIEVILVFINSR